LGLPTVQLLLWQITPGSTLAKLHPGWVQRKEGSRGHARQ
jgi:hypothetical protein